jgi:hypothetical protein
MTEVDLNFISEQLKRLLSEQASMRATLVISAMGQTVLGQMIMRLERDMVQVKRLVGKMDTRISHLELTGGSNG